MKSTSASSSSSTSAATTDSLPTTTSTTGGDKSNLTVEENLDISNAFKKFQASSAAGYYSGKSGSGVIDKSSDADDTHKNHYTKVNEYATERLKRLQEETQELMAALQTAQQEQQSIGSADDQVSRRSFIYIYICISQKKTWISHSRETKIYIKKKNEFQTSILLLNSLTHRANPQSLYYNKPKL